MLNITEYITEKLRINKNTIISHTSDNLDSYTETDIIVWHGFYTKFYRIVKRTRKTFTLVELGTHFLSGAYNAIKYVIEPIQDKENDTVTAKIINGNVISIDGQKGEVELWNGDPVECISNF